MKNNKSFSKRYWFNICLFFLLALALALGYAKSYFDNIFPLSGDGTTEVAVLAFVKESLKNGEWPLWNKYLSAGMPIAGNLSMHSFYLPSIILSFLPLKQYVYSYYILHVSVGAIFFSLLLKQIGCRKEISFAMAFVYLFSINLGGLRKNHLIIIVTAVYLPIIIFFIEKYFETEKFKWLAFAAVAMALQFCGGFVQCVLYSDVFVGTYLLTGALRRKIGWKKIIVDLLMWLGSYFGLIAVQLFPFLELLKSNSVYDQSSNLYEIFTSYSFHPIKLLQMIFPKVFVDEYSSFGAYYSSGLDIELYLGPVIVIMLIVGIRMYRNEYRIKVYGIAAVFVFCWASIACFPPIARAVSKVPLIGTTRAQARIIFIFCFLALLMAGYIGELIVRRNDYHIFFSKVKSVVYTIVIIVIVAFAGAFVFAGAQGFEDEICNSLTDYLKASYVKDVILYLLCLFVVFLLDCNIQKRNGVNRKFFLGVLLALNLIGVLPYSLRSSEVSIGEIMGTDSEQDEFLKENVGNYKVWDDFSGLSGSHQSNISHNKSVIKKIAAINSYTNFCNPRLYMMLSACDSAPLNTSGLLTGNYLSKTNLVTRNDVLSMLGIRYIIDTEGFLETNLYSYSYNDEEREIMNIKTVEGEVTGDGVFASGYTVQLKPHTFYKIAFSGCALVDESVYFDFYGEQYDSSNQRRDFVLTSEKKQYEFYIFSGEKVPEYIAFRFICTNLQSEIMIENVHLTEAETYIVEPYPYQHVNSQGAYNIYENMNANDILYFSNVINMEEGYNIYQTVGLNLNKNSYIEGGEELLNMSSNKEIMDVDFGINSIKANVYTDEDSFLNFSQIFYPGWKVYIDGKEQKIYLVNGVIMGVYVPAGNHFVEFCYKPASVVLGGSISLFTLGGLVLAGIINTRSRMKKRVMDTW